MKLTPLHLKLLLHHYTIPEPWEGQASMHEEQLRNAGLLELAHPSQIDRSYLVTDKGRAHIVQLLALPYPVQAWVGHDGEVLPLTP